MSAEAAKEFLSKYDVDEKSKERIINCIEAHHGAVKFKCIEAEICANADCYRFIHPKGFFLFMTSLGKRNLSFLDCLKSAEEKLDEKYKILSLEICKKELEEDYQILKRFIADARRL